MEAKLYPRLESAYRWQLLEAGDRLYLDKNHPDIWLTERLQSSFPGARFIGIERDPCATVASMMRQRSFRLVRALARIPGSEPILSITQKTQKTFP